MCRMQKPSTLALQAAVAISVTMRHGSETKRGGMPDVLEMKLTKVRWRASWLFMLSFYSATGRGQAKEHANTHTALTFNWNVYFSYARDAYIDTREQVHTKQETKAGPKRACSAAITTSCHQPRVTDPDISFPYPLETRMAC